MGFPPSPLRQDRIPLSLRLLQLFITLIINQIVFPDGTFWYRTLAIYTLSYTRDRLQTLLLKSTVPPSKRSPLFSCRPNAYRLSIGLTDRDNLIVIIDLGACESWFTVQVTII